MPIFSYHTIQHPVTGVYKEKGSRFLAFAYPVETEDAIKAILETLRKEYFDARHHCFAYMLGAEKQKFRAFDDGEPNHSAGDPILGQIRSKHITSVLVVVVRYFGGTRLGVGGLITAYRSATEDVLNKAVIIEKEISKNIYITYGYSSTPEVMRMIKDYELIVKDQAFEDQCKLSADYFLKIEDALIEKIHLLKATGHQIEFDQGK